MQLGEFLRRALLGKLERMFEGGPQFLANAQIESLADQACGLRAFIGCLFRHGPLPFSLWVMFCSTVVQTPSGSSLK